MLLCFCSISLCSVDKCNFALCAREAQLGDYILSLLLTGLSGFLHSYTGSKSTFEVIQKKGKTSWFACLMYRCYRKWDPVSVWLLPVSYKILESAHVYSGLWCCACHKHLFDSIFSTGFFFGCWVFVCLFLFSLCEISRHCSCECLLDRRRVFDFFSPPFITM